MQYQQVDMSSYLDTSQLDMLQQMSKSQNGYQNQSPQKYGDPSLTEYNTFINGDDPHQPANTQQQGLEQVQWSDMQQSDPIQEITLISDDIKIDIDIVNGSIDLVKWMWNVGIEQTDDFLNYVNKVENQLQEKCKSDKDFYYIVERLLWFQFQGFRYQSYPESSFSSSVYHACLDHQFFNENGLNNDYIKTFKRYLAINGTNDINQIENYLKLYALSQTITEQTLTINRTTATQAIYRNEYIIYTDPYLEPGMCSVVCDKCGAKIINTVDAFVEYLEKVYNNESIGDESLSNFHHINCGNQFFTKIGVGIKGSKSGIKSYEYIGMGDPTELDRLQWELLPDFSILSEAFKEGDHLSGRSRRRGGVRTNLTINVNGQVQDDLNSIQQLATITSNAQGVPQQNADITNAFDNIPDNTITSFNDQNGNVVLGVNVIWGLVQIRQKLIELLGNNMGQEEKNLKIVFQFDEIGEQFKRAFRGMDGQKSYKNFQEIVTYLIRFKQFVDEVYENYAQNPHTMYTGNVNEIINIVDTLINWITAVWEKIQVFVQILFWSGQQDDQADRKLQHIRQQIINAQQIINVQQQNAQQQNAQQQQQDLGKNILGWYYHIMLYEFTYGNDRNEQDFQNHVIGLLNGVDPNANAGELFIIYDSVQNNEPQNLPQNHFDLLIQYYGTSIQLNTSLARDLQNFIIMLYAYLLCRNDTENANMFNQMICELKHVKAQIKQVHVFRIAHLIDLGKQIHCLWENNSIQWIPPGAHANVAWGGDPPQVWNEHNQRNVDYVVNAHNTFDVDGFYGGQGLDLYQNRMTKNYALFSRNVMVFQKALQAKIAPQLEPIRGQLNPPQVPRQCLFQIQHQIPLNTQDIGDDQDIQDTNDTFGQVYDGMNVQRLNIVFSPIFDKVPIHTAIAADLRAALRAAIAAAPDAALAAALNAALAAAPDAALAADLAVAFYVALADLRAALRVAPNDAFAVALRVALRAAIAAGLDNTLATLRTALAAPNATFAAAPNAAIAAALRAAIAAFHVAIAVGPADNARAAFRAAIAVGHGAAISAGLRAAIAAFHAAIAAAALAVGPNAALAAVNPGDVLNFALDSNVIGLNQRDIDYFQKQSVKYMITHNMLKYHYPEITLQTQNRFVNQYIVDQVGQKMNTLIHEVINKLRISQYVGVYNRDINGNNKRNIVLTVAINGNNCDVVVEQHDGSIADTLVYKINVIGRSRGIFNQNIGDWYTPWEQIYLIFDDVDNNTLINTVFGNGVVGNQDLIDYISFLHEQYMNVIRRKYNYNYLQRTCKNQYRTQFNDARYITKEFYNYCNGTGGNHRTIIDNYLQHLYGLVQKINIKVQAVYVNHGLFYICPNNKDILEDYKYFLELPAVNAFDKDNGIQQKFFKLQIYGKFLYDLIINHIGDNNLYSFTQTSSAYSTLVNMWLHADDNLQQANPVPNQPPNIPQAVTNIIDSIPIGNVANHARNITPWVLDSLNKIYNEAFQNQQPQGFMKSIIKQIICILVLKSFVHNNQYVFQDEGIRHVNVNGVRVRVDNGGTFRGAYMDIINTKFEKIRELIDIFIPVQNNRPNYNEILKNIQYYIRQMQYNGNVDIQFDQNNFNNFIDALRNLAGQCAQQYQLVQNINLLPPPPPHPAP